MLDEMLENGESEACKRESVGTPEKQWKIPAYL
jgi:hypothetical protein